MISPRGAWPVFSDLCRYCRFGLYQLEALASGVPLVQPDLGAFPEIILATGGGVLYQPNTADALATSLAAVLSDPVQLERMSLAGRKSVEEKFDCKNLTSRMLEVYEKVSRKTRRDSGRNY